MEPSPSARGGPAWQGYVSPPFLEGSGPPLPRPDQKRVPVAEIYALWRAVARPAVALAKAGPSLQFLNGHWGLPRAYRGCTR